VVVAFEVVTGAAVSAGDVIAKDTVLCGDSTLPATSADQNSRVWEPRADTDTEVPVFWAAPSSL